MTLTDKKLWFFGCIGQPGHYWFGDCNYRGPAIEGVNKQLFAVIDSTFPPGITTQGIYNDVVVDKVRIVSWWDYTGDKRPGSNSNLVGVGYESAEQMIDDAINKFPQAMSRQPRPVPNT